MSKLLRTDLPDEVWGVLNEEAERAGLKIGVYAKRLLIERAEQIEAGATPSTNPWDDTALFTRAVQWMKDNPAKMRGYGGGRDMKDTRDRAAAWAWITGKGFTP